MHKLRFQLHIKRIAYDFELDKAHLNCVFGCISRPYILQELEPLAHLFISYMYVLCVYLNVAIYQYDGYH